MSILYPWRRRTARTSRRIDASSSTMRTAHSEAGLSITGGPAARSAPTYNRAMQAYGSDRVRSEDGERVVLLSRIPKAWTPRAPKTLTTAEFPGTAVLWEERYFEVLSAEALPQGGVRYVLGPWQEMHA